MNPNDSYYAGDTLHELGHYLLGVLDEYEDEDGGPAICTLQSAVSGTPFSEGGSKDSCFMRGARGMNKKKLCSSHPDNPHALGTEQGPQDCWSAALSRYDDHWWLQGLGFERWRLRSPATRGVIIDRLPDSGVPIQRTTQPDENVQGDDVQVPSFIPVAGWKPRVHSIIDHRGTLVDGVVVRTEFNGVPVRKQKVLLHSHTTGRTLFEGVTKAAYHLAYGLTTGDGEIPLRGAHLDDDVTVIGPAPNGGIFVGNASITQPQPHTLVISLTRIPLPFAIELEPLGVGALGIRVPATAALAAAGHSPDVYIADSTAGPASYMRIRPSNGNPVVGGLPHDGSPVAVAIAGVTGDGKEIMDEKGAVLYRVDEPISCRSSDGRLKLRLQADTFDAPHQVMVESPGADSPVDTPIGEVVSGPYRLAIAPDDRLGREAALTFRLPSAELPARDLDESIGSLVILELESRSGDWQECNSTGNADPAFVSTRINHSGTYALVQRSLAKA
jgi:hypothetical protein